MAKLGDDMQNGPSSSSVAVIKKQRRGEKQLIYLVKATHEVRICTNEASRSQMGITTKNV
jgi:hypothetical protein